VIPNYPSSSFFIKLSPISVSVPTPYPVLLDPPLFLLKAEPSEFLGFSCLADKDFFSFSDHDHPHFTLHTCYDQIQPQNGESKIRLHHANVAMLEKALILHFKFLIVSGLRCWQKYYSDLFNVRKSSYMKLYRPKMLLRSCTRSKKNKNKKLNSFHLHFEDHRPT
jgi:hypothetical protein